MNEIAQLITGEGMHSLMQSLFPICRSITGDGVRASLDILGKHVPVKECEVPSGTKVFDWVVPDEWNISEAYIVDEHGCKLVDFCENNLHVVGYSEPIDQVMSFEELSSHLYSFPDKPHTIPYRTSYYKRNWGFCLQHDKLKLFNEGNFHVVINSSLKSGHLTYGELIIQGDSDDEILLSTNICHPSMANNELSGVTMLAGLAQWLLQKETRRYTYRLLWLPETIGAITYLSQHSQDMKKKTAAGYQVVCTGGPDDFVYLQTRRENQLSDRVMEHVLKNSGQAYKIIDFTHRASDERQWGSPGIDLPIGSLMRSKYHDYEEYHTSDDNLDFVTAAQLQSSFDIYCQALDILEYNDYYLVNVGGCEPNLGKRGLYPSTGGQNHKEQQIKSILALVAYCDGEHDIIDIANKHEVKASIYIPVIKSLLEYGLLIKKGS
jgi:aminopeptidase-like protein